MPVSEYVQRLRAHVGHEYLLLPAVTAVIEDGDRFLVARHRDSRLWSLVGGGIEPGEAPDDAVRREVREELGLTPVVHGIVGAYGGPDLENTYPNGDRVGYVTVAYRCSLPDATLTVDHTELLELRWVTATQVPELDRHTWIDRVLDDANRAKH
jgi:8-oxo-dGTP pyrophosphatase MutT (NUDIX family)